MRTCPACGERTGKGPCDYCGDAGPVRGLRQNRAWMAETALAGVGGLPDGKRDARTTSGASRGPSKAFSATPFDRQQG
jgi:hypothetical protein